MILFNLIKGLGITKTKASEMDSIETVINSFANPSFLNGYDDCVLHYLAEHNRKHFLEEEVIKIISSNQFKSAFIDVDNFDLSLVVEGFPVGGEYAGGADNQDDYFSDNYVYMKDLVDSLFKYRGSTFRDMTDSEVLLRSEFVMARHLGFALHFVINYASEYASAQPILDGYTELCKSEVGKQFIKSSVLERCFE